MRSPAAPVPSARKSRATVAAHPGPWPWSCADDSTGAASDAAASKKERRRRRCRCRSRAPAAPRKNASGRPPRQPCSRSLQATPRWCSSNQLRPHHQASRTRRRGAVRAGAGAVTTCTGDTTAGAGRRLAGPRAGGSPSLAGAIEGAISWEDRPAPLERSCRGGGRARSGTKLAGGLTAHCERRQFPGWERRVFTPEERVRPPHAVPGPVRLVVQDSSPSSCRHRFDSGTGYHQ